MDSYIKDFSERAWNGDFMSSLSQRWCPLQKGCAARYSECVHICLSLFDPSSCNSNTDLCQWNYLQQQCVISQNDTSCEYTDTYRRIWNRESIRLSSFAKRDDCPVIMYGDSWNCNYLSILSLTAGIGSNATLASNESISFSSSLAGLMQRFTSENLTNAKYLLDSNLQYDRLVINARGNYTWYATELTMECRRLDSNDYSFLPEYQCSQTGVTVWNPKQGECQMKCEWYNKLECYIRAETTDCKWDDSQVQCVSQNTSTTPPSPPLNNPVIVDVDRTVNVRDVDFPSTTQVVQLNCANSSHIMLLSGF
eukprot:PhF_6_TR10387/c1_g3_i11/m.16222